MPDDLSGAVLAEAAFAVIDDAASLQALLNELEPSRAEATILGLETYEGKFRGIDPVSAVTVLLNQISRLDREPAGMFDFGPQNAIARVVRRLLRTMNEPENVRIVVDQVLPSVQSATAKCRLLSIVGHEENAGSKLISEEAWRTFSDDLRQEIRGMSPVSLAKEVELLHLLWWAGSNEDPPTWHVPDDHFDNSTFAAALLTRSVSVGHSQGMGSRAVNAVRTLHWDTLVETVGGEDAVRRCRDNAALELGCDSEVLKLVDSYLGGWRPER
jgi:hypothetical protein